MTADGQPFRVTSEPVPVCERCGHAGVLRYEGVRDRAGDAPATWRLRRCPDCRYLWLDPRPSLADLGKLYDAGYASRHLAPPPDRFGSTREGLGNAALRRLGYDRPKPGAIYRLGARLPFVFERVAFGAMFLPGRSMGRLLDVGCGTGRLARSLIELGWDVTGVEPDPESARIARGNGIEVHIGTLEEADLPPGPFDAAVMNHVIEHLVDPLAGLRAIHSRLRPGGRLAVVTPNVDSLVHRLFGSSWYGLDPPRHIRVFSLSALERLLLASGFDVAYRRTNGRGARRWAILSSRIRRTGRTVDDGRPTGFGTHLLAVGSMVVEELVRPGARLGEELVVVGTKRD